MTKKAVSRNVVWAIVLYGLSMINGFLVPKIILLSFGSEINGLVSSINQIISFITLLEGGVSGVVMANLYAPLYEHDEIQLNRVISSSRFFFRKIAVFYLFYLAVIVAVYPLLVKAGVSGLYMRVLIVVMAFNLFTQYFFSITWKLLLQADQRAYFVSIVQCVTLVLSLMATFLAVKLFHDIVAVKLICSMVFCLQPLLFIRYAERHYPIRKDVPGDPDVIKQRWDGLSQNIAYFVHSNTDIVLLTLFAPLTVVSVYAVYNMVINALKSLMISISSAVVPTLGNLLASKDSKRINNAFDLYEFIVLASTTFLFATGLFLLVPFVSVYTANIHDADYSQPLFAALLMVAEAVYCIRDPYVSVSYAAGHFRQTKAFAFGEALINILISLVLVRIIGLVGVAIGTLTAMLFRTIVHIVYLKNHILYRPKWKTLRTVLIFFVCGVLMFVLNRILFVQAAADYLDWFVLAIKASSVSLIILLIVSTTLFKNRCTQLKSLVINRLEC